MENYEKFQNLINSAHADFDKFYNKGVLAAGTRLRKKCQEIAMLCKDTRKDVIVIKNSRKQGAQ